MPQKELLKKIYVLNIWFSILHIIGYTGIDGILAICILISNSRLKKSQKPTVALKRLVIAECIHDAVVAVYAFILCCFYSTWEKALYLVMFVFFVSLLVFGVKIVMKLNNYTLYENNRFSEKPIYLFEYRNAKKRGILLSR